MPVIGLHMLVRIIQGRLLVLELPTRCLQVPLDRCCLLLRGGSRLNSSRTVIASSVTADRPVVDNRLVNIGVVHRLGIHPPDRRVVLKSVALPTTSVKT